MSKRCAYLSTIQVCLDVVTDAMASDSISAQLYDQAGFELCRGEPASRQHPVVDWAYARIAGHLLRPTSQIVPEPYEPPGFHALTASALNSKEAFVATIHFCLHWPGMDFRTESGELFEAMQGVWEGHPELMEWTYLRLGGQVVTPWGIKIPSFEDYDEGDFLEGIQ